ncbi:calaxin [Drosophila tropicalis]|uniref:calaxin n=1 Tax=Drosophila tropicalis TaxID=46794 RepID=UPI0035ABB25F
MDYLDGTIDSMQNSRFAALYAGLAKELSVNTHLTHTDVTCLLIVYYKFVLSNGPTAKMMKKSQFYHLFLVLFNLSNEKLIDRILLAIATDVKYFSAQAWIKLFTLYTTKDLSTKMQFAFEVYNTKGTGYIDREQVVNAVEHFFSGDDEDEINELRADMCEFIIKKFDVDRDGLISYEDYSAVVSEQPCLLEFLGLIFPSVDVNDTIAHCINLSTLWKNA